MKNLVCIAHNTTEIQIGYHLNTRLEHYCYINVLRRLELGGALVYFWITQYLVI